jgi:hypothetical protein
MMPYFIKHFYAFNLGAVSFKTVKYPNKVFNSKSVLALIITLICKFLMTVVYCFFTRVSISRLLKVVIINFYYVI